MCYFITMSHIFVFFLIKKKKTYSNKFPLNFGQKLVVGNKKQTASGLRIMFLLTHPSTPTSSPYNNVLAIINKLTSVQG